MKKYFLMTLLTVFALFASANNNNPQRETRDGYYYEYNIYEYPFSGSGWSVIYLDGVEVQSAGYEVGLFSGDVCRGHGITVDTYVGTAGHYFAQISFNGENGVTVIDGFRLYDHNTNQELNVTCLNEPISYVDNLSIGTPMVPYVFNFTSVTTITYTVTATPNPANGGTVTGGGDFEAGAECTLTATANAGYTFNNWTLGDEVVSTNPTYTFPVTEAADYVANFLISTYDITVTANPTAGGTVTGNGTYNHGASVTLTATPNTGYTFTNWTLNGQVVSTEQNYTFGVVAAGNYVANFSMITFQITAIANPTAGGTVTGAATYNYNALVTLTATPAEGYHFVNWTKNGSDYSTEATISFNALADGNYVANFELNSYEITVTADPTTYGSVTGADTYNHFSNCTLTATPNTGYHFVNWTKDGNQVSTNATYTFEVVGGGNYVAHFAVNTYTISVSANPTAGGTVSGGATYEHFATATLTATPNTGYTFTNWTKNGTVVSTDLTYSFEVTSGGSYVANFQGIPCDVDATVGVGGGGNVQGAGTHPYGSTVTLTAIPDEGYHFVNWTLDGTVFSTNPTITVTVTGPANYVANFAINSYAITAESDPIGAGILTGAATYNHFETCTMTATPTENYHFVNWTLNGTVVSSNPTFSFTVTGGANYVAHFEPDAAEIDVMANPAEGGVLTGDGTYSYGSTCTLSAVANAGYTFLYWTRYGSVVSTDATFSFTVTGNASYVAHFSLNTYVITVATIPGNGGTVTGGGTYSHGATVTLTATPNEGYTFVHWTKNGYVVSYNSTYTFTASSDGDYVASFQPYSFTISATADPEDAGVVIGAGVYNIGITATLTAIANPGYEFVQWTKDGVHVSSRESFNIIVTEDASYVAHFSVGNHVVTTSAQPDNGGTVTGAGTYQHGTNCTVTATPNDGYMFVRWMVNGEEVSTEASYTFQVMENTHCIAVFVSSSCQVLAIVDPEQGGVVTGAGTYTYGETVTLTLTPNEDYHFINWTENGEVFSEELTITFVVEGNRLFTAHLEYTEGIGEHNGFDVTVFPNPAIDKLSVEASEPIRLLEIFSINGVLVYSKKNCEATTEVKVSDFATGTYMIRLTTDKAVEMRRFVKE